MAAPTLIITGVNTDGQESEPFVYEGSDNVIAYNIDPVKSYIDDERRLIIRLNFMAATTQEAFRSGMYARFAGSVANLNASGIGFVRHRVCRFTRSHIPNDPLPDHHGDFLVQGNFIVPADAVATTSTGLGITLASPLFDNKVVVEDDVETTEVEKPTEFAWKLPNLTGLDHYVIYALGNDGFFREVDTTTEGTYRIGKGETFRSLGAIPINSGRKYHIGIYPFTSPDNYPSVVSFYKQRKVFAGSNRNPDTIWMSKVGDYGNYVVGTEDDEAIEVTLASNTIDRITHIIPLGDMWILSEGSTWLLRNEGALTPANVSFLKAGNIGSGRSIDPYIVDGLLLFVPSTNNDIVQSVFDFNTESYSLKSITPIARHLFSEPIREIGYNGNQHPFLTATLNTDADNITGLVAVFNRTDDIIAWSPWTTEGGRFNQMIPDPSGQGIYFLIRRVDPMDAANTILSIEKFDPKSTTYTDGQASSTYPFLLETIPLEGENGVGISDSYSVSDVYLKLNNASTYTVGIDEAEQSIIETTPFTGTKRVRVESHWGRDSTVVVEDTSANPFELLSLAVEGRVQKKTISGNILPEEDDNVQNPENDPRGRS